MDYDAHKIPPTTGSPSSSGSGEPFRPKAATPGYASEDARQQNYAPSSPRMDFLNGKDRSDASTSANPGAVDPYSRGDYSPIAFTGSFDPITSDLGESSFIPPDELPDPSSDATDMSRNWAMLVGQGPTQVEGVADKDALARQTITEALIGLLRNRFTTAPLAIGLFGEWGSGKSSQVNFVKEKLANPAAGAPRIRVVEFNAWEHEKCDNLSAALAQTVVEQLVQGTSLTDQWLLAYRLAARRRAHITEAAQKDRAKIVVALYGFLSTLFSYQVVTALLLVFLLFKADISQWLTSASVGALGLFGWTLFKKYITDNLTNWFKRIAAGAGGGPFGLPDFAAKLGSFHEIRQTLQHLVFLCIENRKDKQGWDNPREGEYLLIVVDDLDRCNVGTIKLVLDAVRLVTNLPRVVTMLAVDDRIVFPAVESYFEQFKGSGRDATVVARDYLAKVFNVSISLPPVPEAMASKFIAERLFADEHRTAAPPSAPATPAAPPTSEPVSTMPELPEGTALITGDEIKDFTRLAIALGMTNPRALWRMKQAWYLLRNMALSFDPESSFEPWMRSLFVREAILSLPPAARSRVDAWAAAVKNSKSPPDLGDAIPIGLAYLLDEDWLDVRNRWHYADIVLLPAAVGT